ncbi:SMI1/KNR4 family protein [Micromonospora sp. DR5-3]|uniref:SMI1/KNR4 family protein n=1 Tax=unclassified Micromonospora TaxID=2617518 RepID=UPI0011D33D21|nr:MULTISPECIES: SMI1/KNR4 family protein [unclassified Micromonospora]MCW3819325.1 SMI1/KNR4 family protein [Micromonospora sp. DR5-3]TYC21763.1 SMI1/KNR4 family protein [Micromonospora sp. MP36]
MTDYHELLGRLARRAGEDEPTVPLEGGLPAPLSRARIAEAEQRLGFPLHPLLAAIYRDVANGGFGPDYQLLSLIDGPTEEQAVDCYTEARTAHAGTEWAWPEGVLPILTWGCGMYACVDCRSAEGTVLLFEPNPGDPDVAWWIDSPSLRQWLEHYIHDTGWWVKAEEGEGLDDMPPWPHARARAGS